MENDYGGPRTSHIVSIGGRDMTRMVLFFFSVAFITACLLEAAFGQGLPKSDLCKLYIDDQVATLDMPRKKCAQLLQSLLPRFREEKKGTSIYCQCIEGSSRT